MRKNDPKHVKVVGRVASRPDVRVGKPDKIVTSAMRIKTAFPAVGGSMLGAGGNWYSPELSPDFLELPQSLDEQRNYYRFFYDHDPFVGQALDLHTDLPLSKIRLRMPKARNRELGKKAMRFCERWAKANNLFYRLIEILHDLNLIGEVFIFAEDTSPEMPREVREEPIREIKENGDLVETWREYEDADKRAVEWLNQNYSGWSAIRVLPPEQVHVEPFAFTDQKIIQLIPDSKTKNIVNKAVNGDTEARRIVSGMPIEVVQAVRDGTNLTLNTDPDAGSFVYHMTRKKSQYEPRGKSLLQRCLRVLIYRDKLRQAQTSIASRHMTPFRLIYAEDMDEVQTEELREQVDLALQDPDYSIITNFQVNWEEMGADQRLLDLSSEYDLTDRQLYAGLSVTESLLSGESSYSGDRINLEVINTRYMLTRELLQEFVEEYIFKPMCRIMGFVEEDEDGILTVLTPKLSFTRLALRDNSDTFDILWNLYTKGSLDIDIILDLLNLDPDTVREKLERDKFTLQDATFNEALRSIYSRVGDSLAEHSDVAELIAKNLGLKYQKPEEEGGGGGRW